MRQCKPDEADDTAARYTESGLRPGLKLPDGPGSYPGPFSAINEPAATAFLSSARGWVIGENLRTGVFSIEATGDAGRTWATQYTTG
jgi:hypothetical protein